MKEFFKRYFQKIKYFLGILSNRVGSFIMNLMGSSKKLKTIRIKEIKRELLIAGFPKIWVDSKIKYIENIATMPIPTKDVLEFFFLKWTKRRKFDYLVKKLARKKLVFGRLTIEQVKFLMRLINQGCDPDRILDKFEKEFSSNSTFAPGKKLMINN